MQTQPQYGDEYHYINRRSAFGDGRPYVTSAKWYDDVADQTLWEKNNVYNTREAALDALRRETTPVSCR